MPAIGQEIFEGFDAHTLSTAINAADYRGGIIHRRGIFTERPVSTTAVEIEIIDDTISLVQSSPRGGIGHVHAPASRGTVRFSIPHIVARGTMLAASWQDRRGFGSGALADVNAERDRELLRMRANLEATIEFHRARALAGAILDADGSTLVDLLSEFGVSQQSQGMALGTTTTSIRTKLVEAKRKAEAALGAAALSVTGWVAFCSHGFMDALVSHGSVAQWAEGWSGGAAALRDDQRGGEFEMAGIRFVEVPEIAGAKLIDDDAALLVPEGVPDLFITHFAPSDTWADVNASADRVLPIYARAEPLPMDKGVRLEAQSNPLSICTRPRAVVKLTKT